MVQELLLKVGMLGYVIPLLFGYDPTQDPEAQADHFDYTGQQRPEAAAFRDLGMQRSNMQVSMHLQATCHKARANILQPPVKQIPAAPPCRAPRADICLRTA